MTPYGPDRAEEIAGGNIQVMLWRRERQRLVAGKVSGEDDSLQRRAPFSLAVLRGGIFSDLCIGQKARVRLR